MRGIVLDIPEGKYRVEWVKPSNGQYQVDEIEHAGGVLKLSPFDHENGDVTDLALGLREIK